MIQLKNVKVSLEETVPLEVVAANYLKLPQEVVQGIRILRKGIDARRYHGAPTVEVYTLAVEFGKLSAKQKERVKVLLKKDPNVLPVEPLPKREAHVCKRNELRPVVVGFGPAGMFAAWTLAKAGLAPLVLERGKDVDTRTRDVAAFWKTGKFCSDSNVQFGEGGAGTFSDGKLTTRVSDPHSADVLDALIASGAPEEIRYLHKPHIGTDLLRTVVKNFRRTIIEMGAEVRFSAQVTDLEAAGERISALVVNGEERIPAETVFLGIGHSARDTYAMLYNAGVSMEAKPFAIGVRIEHPQEWIDRNQYAELVGHPKLPISDYALTYKDEQTGRGAYSFCMCPGGQVVAATSERGRVVTNGMSNHARNSGIANAALLVNVSSQDFGAGVLSGIAFQREIEERAFHAAGGDYFAPVQTVGDFLAERMGSKDFTVQPSYQPGVRPCDFRALLPPVVAETLAHALPVFGKKIKGFAEEGIPMTGVETRSSAPCRILRQKENFQSNVQGFYPIGEGAGYAGGIMSAAMDGMKAAEAYLDLLK